MIPKIEKITQSLIDKVIQREKDAINLFVELSEKIIYGAIHQFNGLDIHEMADLFQNIYLKLFEDDMRRIKLWKGDSEFSTYLYRIVINLVKDYLGSAYYQRFLRTELLSDSSEDDRTPVTLVADQPEPDFVLQSIEVALMVSKLRDVEQAVIRYYYFEGYKEREIAEMLDFPINTISSIKNRAIKKMRLQMDKSCPQLRIQNEY
ncbi:MAG: RNA polymerase sigma factor [Fidelibacterota bacterium]